VPVGRLSIGAAAAVLVFAATACGERSEPTGAKVHLYPVTVTSATDRPLAVHGPAQRIAVLDTSLLSTLKALGAHRQVVGMPVDPSGSIELQKLKQMRPDLIVASSMLTDVQLSRAAAAAHAPVYVAPGDSIRGVEQAITDLGLLAGQPVTARRLVHRIEEKRHFVDAKLASVRQVSVFVDTGLFTTVSDQSLVADLLREAHGRNVAGDVVEAAPFDLRQLAELDPHVYLATSDSGTTLRDLRRNPQTRKLTAVRKGRFAIVDAALLEPGTRVGTALVVLARLLHPDAFR
jgi:iron complex transport system substrate-binding protein